MALVSLEEAKAYLRVDSSYEDSLIESLLASAEAACMETARLDLAEWDSVIGEEDDPVTIRGEERDRQEISGWPSTFRVAELFVLGYLYEHRAEANHHSMFETLRNLLSFVREGVL